MKKVKWKLSMNKTNSLVRNQSTKLKTIRFLNLLNSEIPYTIEYA